MEKDSQIKTLQNDLEVFRTEYASLKQVSSAAAKQSEQQCHFETQVPLNSNAFCHVFCIKYCYALR